MSSPFQNPNPAIRDLTPGIATCRNQVEILQPYRGCWRVTLNGAPQSDWSDEAAALAHAKRLGFRAPGAKQGNPAPMTRREAPNQAFGE